MDILSISKGTVVSGVTIDRDGWFLSDKYVEEVMKARIKK